MDHMRLSDELRKQLMEAAAWGRDEVAPRLDESEVVEEAAKKDEMKEKKEKKAKKPVEEAEVEECEEEAEEVSEAEHVCPLCASELNEALDSEAIYEHLDTVMALVDRLSQLNEGDEDLDEVIDETLYNSLFGDDEDEAE